MPTKILTRDENNKPLACTCKECGAFTLDTLTELCSACYFVHGMADFFAMPVFVTSPKKEPHAD